MQSSHATAPVAHRKAAPDGASRTDGPRPPAGDHPHTSRPALRGSGRGPEQNSRREKGARTMRERSPDPYEVLHLGRAATAREVARAYRALVRTRHPDTAPRRRRARRPGLHGAGRRSCRRSWMPTPFSGTPPSGPPTTGNSPRRPLRNLRPHRSLRRRAGTPDLTGLT